VIWDPKRRKKSYINISPDISRFPVIATFMFKKMYFIFRVASLFKFFIKFLIFFNFQILLFFLINNSIFYFFLFFDICKYIIF